MMDRYLRTSPNFIWNTNLILGKGATANVYQGMSKTTGQLVAVKSFNQNVNRRPFEVQREYEVLKKINHINIVRLFASEQEEEFKHHILIMELSTGGSLFNILDDPSNSFGLDEREFLLVLDHVATGMKHLTDMNIIHRDLKPGNIMKFITEDGQSIYKLSDFGAARELDQDQKFMSLCGTEEYLHPDLYERAVLKKPALKSFSAKVDLWSIGVTLYHVATGSLPFRPYGGRKNQQIMYKIITEKLSGVISGVQHDEDGDIEWDNSLPKTCLLSPSLQDMLTPLLAGLLETDEFKTWSFDKFYRSVYDILSLRPIHVFCVNRMNEFVFYMKKDEKISDLKAKLELEDYAGIQAQSQLLSFNKKEIKSDQLIHELFTTLDNPLILLTSNPAGRIMRYDPNFIKFPNILSKQNVTGEQVAQTSKACSAIAYCLHRNILETLRYFELLQQVPHQTTVLIEANVKLLNEKREFCSTLIESLRDRIDYTIETSLNLKKCCDIINNKDYAFEDITSLRTALNELKYNWEKLAPQIADINRRAENMTGKWLRDKNIAQTKLFESLKIEQEFDDPNLVISRAKSKSEIICTRIKESWVFLHRNKSYKTSSSPEGQLVHDLERLRIDNHSRELSNLFYDDCLTAINCMVDIIDEWFDDITLTQTDFVYNELTKILRCKDDLFLRLDKVVECQHQSWQTLLAKLSSVPKISLPDNENKQAMINSLSYPRELESSSDCCHSSNDLEEEIHNLKGTQKVLNALVSESQNLFSELVSITTPKNSYISNGQYTMLDE